MGQDYCQNRQSGKFINADVVMGKRGALLSHNLFAYCLNSPIAYADLNGLWRLNVNMLSSRIRIICLLMRLFLPSLAV